MSKMRTLAKLTLAGLISLGISGNAISEEKDKNVIFPKEGEKISMPEIPEVEERCKRYGNFGSPDGKILGVLVEIDLRCGKILGAVYENKRAAISVGYLICNSMRTAEKIPFGIYFKPFDRLYVDKDRDGNVDYLRNGITKSKRRIYQDAPACTKGA